MVVIRVPYKSRIELLQGTLDMLILHALQWQDLHGYAIAQAIQNKAGDVLQVKTGSLYPALHRLERQKWIKSEWKLLKASSARQVLSDHCNRKETVDVGPSAVAPNGAGYRRGDGTERGEIVMRWFWNRSKQDLSEELESHLRMSIEDRIANGESPAHARKAAMREFGNIPLIEDVTRENWGWVWLENALQDARYVFRQLRRSPGFTVTVLLTLALGIGANLAVFQLLYSAILATLPVADPQELVTVQAAKTPFDQSWQISYEAYHRLRASTGDEAPLLARTAFGEAVLQLPGEGSSRANYELVSDNFFSVLAVRPAAGRLFVQDDARIGQSEWPAVVRYGFALDHFASAQQALGKHVLLNGVPAVIVGVADSRFLGVVTGYAPGFWLPLERRAQVIFG